MSKVLLNGYQSAIRGAYEAACDTVCVSDPRYLRVACDMPCLVAANALQYALGASIAGHRAVAVCNEFDTDELSSIAHVGVNASLVVVVTDNVHRPYFDLRAMCVSAHLPMMEPADVYECKTYVKIACNLSEKYDVPVFVHIGQSLLDTYEQIEVVEPKKLMAKPYKRNVEKYVTLPTSNRLCAEDMVVRDKRMSSECDAFPVHRAEFRDRTMGVICYGEAYAALMVAAPHLSVLRLGMVFPLPMQVIRDFAAGVEDLVVMEEGEPIVEHALRAADVRCHGEDLFPLRMRYNPGEIRERLLGVEMPKDDTSLPIRTAGFCADCALIELFTALKKADVIVHADTRCAFLGANMPMVCVDTAFASSPVALGAGFASHMPCVSVLDADCVDLNDFRLPMTAHCVFIYGDVAPLEPVMRVLQPDCAVVPVGEVAARVGKAGVWLVPMTTECRHE